jgi:hypothetical protein
MKHFSFLRRCSDGATSFAVVRVTTNLKAVIG